MLQNAFVPFSFCTYVYKMYWTLEKFTKLKSKVTWNHSLTIRLEIVLACFFSVKSYEKKTTEIRPKNVYKGVFGERIFKPNQESKNI